jgi:aldehyde:ferredoxin oxidoreductase
MASVASQALYTRYSELKFSRPDMFDYETNASIYAALSDLNYLHVSAGACKFGMWGMDTFPLVESISAVTGWDFTLAEGLKVGRRIQTLRQAFNLREGANTGEWQLPQRVTSVLSAGPTAGRKFDWKTVKEKGYAALGWDAASGKPLDSTLKELGLEGLVI